MDSVTGLRIRTRQGDDTGELAFLSRGNLTPICRMERILGVFGMDKGYGGDFGVEITACAGMTVWFDDTD